MTRKFTAPLPKRRNWTAQRRWLWPETACGWGCFPAGRACWTALTARAKAAIFCWALPPLVLTPQSDCHLLAVRLTGHCADAYLLQLGAARWADGAACPGAAELIAQLCGAQTAPMAYALLCAAAKADETARPLPPLVAEAVAAIRQNYMALYGVEELSEQLGVTKSHLVRVFKQEMGVPPGKYMTNVRIEAVKTLLLTDEYNLDMIAGLTGFSGANYLCRVFKREVGLSPAAWRTAAAPLPAVPKLPPRSQEMYV